MEMNSYDFERYYECMSIIKAKNLIWQLKANDWPNMSRGSRSEFHRTLHKAANPKLEEAKEAKGEDMARMIKGLMGGR